MLPRGAISYTKSSMQLRINLLIKHLFDCSDKIYSHANMVVNGSKSMVIYWIDGKTCSAMPFDPSIGCMKSVPIVDVAIAYDCSYTHQTYILIGRNVIYIKTLKDNLIASFIMRKAGIIVDKKPKIQCNEPSIDNHSLYIPDLDLTIPLKLNEIFSYFLSARQLRTKLIIVNHSSFH